MHLLDVERPVQWRLMRWSVGRVLRLVLVLLKGRRMQHLV